MLTLRRPDPSPLAGLHPFGRYPADVVRCLGLHATRLRVREGVVLARPGQGGREAIAVLAGEALRLCADEPAGVGTLGPGAWVGAAEVLTGARHAATVVAGAGLEVVVVNGPAFRWALGALPGLADDVC